MSQRAYVELTRLGHEVSIGLATSEKAMYEAVGWQATSRVTYTQGLLVASPASLLRILRPLAWG